MTVLPTSSTEKEWELWEVSSEKWTLPIDVLWTEDTQAIVEPADGVPFLNLQRMALQQVFAAFGWEANGHCWMTREKLERIGCPSKHTDPEKVVYWALHSPDIQTSGFRSQDETEFLNGLIRGGIFKSRESAQYMWDVIVKHMVHWILAQNKTLDLGFCRIRALPYRVNWKTILIDHVGLPKDSNIEYERRWVENLLRAEMSCLDQNRKCINRCLDIQPTDYYWTNVRKIETVRKKRHGSSYWKRIHELMKAALPDAWSSYLFYVKEMLQPFPFCCVRGVEGHPGLPKNWSRLDQDRKALRKPDGVSGSPDRYSWQKPDRFLECLDKKKKSVPEVPDI